MSLAASTAFAFRVGCQQDTAVPWPTSATQGLVAARAGGGNGRPGQLLRPRQPGLELDKITVNPQLQ